MGQTGPEVNLDGVLSHEVALFGGQEEGKGGKRRWASSIPFLWMLPSFIHLFALFYQSVSQSVCLVCLVCVICICGQ